MSLNKESSHLNHPITTVNCSISVSGSFLSYFLNCQNSCAHAIFAVIITIHIKQTQVSLNTHEPTQQSVPQCKLDYAGSTNAGLNKESSHLSHPITTP